MSNPIGRPTMYTKELAEDICNTIASSELGLIHLCKQNPHWPARSKIFEWRLRHADFGDMYRKAKEYQAHACVEYMQELMNEEHRFIDEETGYVKIDVPLLRLKLDHYKWHAAKLAPRDFGESKFLESGNTEMDEDCRKRYEEMNERNKKEF